MILNGYIIKLLAAG